MNSTMVPSFGLENIMRDGRSTLDRLFGNVIIMVLYFSFNVIASPSSTSSGSSFDMSDAFGSTSSSQKSGAIQFMEIIFWGTFIFLLLINGLEYFFEIDVKATIRDVFTDPKVDVKVIEDSVEEVRIPPKPLEQVFHIPGNEYTYEDAKSLCKAYGARLATYDEVENSYNKGGEWCSYGWSDKQLALYPTQKTTYDKLQTIKGHEHDCGRPGVNGGFINNKKTRFGVNCYGRKPKINAEEQKLMNDIKPYPETEKDKKLDERIQHFREKLPDILIAPFNKHNWSRI